MASVTRRLPRFQPLARRDYVAVASGRRLKPKARGSNNVPLRQTIAATRTAVPVRTPSYADRDGDVKRLGGADAGCGEGGAAGAGLRGGSGKTERQRCRSRSGAEEKERERDRIADSERAEEQEERDRTHEPAGGHERPCLRRAPSGVVRVLTQRPSRKRNVRRLAASRGSAEITAAAATPAAATTASPIRTPVPASGSTAPASASGARATLSIRPSMTSERQSTRTPAGHRGKRRTTAIRIASSKRPGRRIPTRAAPPLPAASASSAGRSDGVNSRPQPKALSAWASTRSTRPLRARRVPVRERPGHRGEVAGRQRRQHEHDRA